VLVVHGVTGGCDHGPGIVRSYLGEGFRSLSVSRFGYLRSPLPTDASPAAQADIYEALLDELGIERVGVVATFAGTSSALQFALRHPGRCAGLALFSMAVGPYRVPPRLVVRAQRMYFGSDFLCWLTLNFSKRVTWRLIGIPSSTPPLAPADERFVDDLKATFLPVSRRVEGIINDVCESNPGVNDIEVFSAIRVPVLAVHTRDDPWGSLDGARRQMAHLPTARVVELDDGGHLLLGHRDEARAIFAAFLRAQLSQRAPSLA
jgi:pimeloyl-ACP methyl ester carboxylesterase